MTPREAIPWSNTIAAVDCENHTGHGVVINFFFSSGRPMDDHPDLNIVIDMKYSDEFIKARLVAPMHSSLAEYVKDMLSP